MGHGFTSRWQELESGFDVAVQRKKRGAYI